MGLTNESSQEVPARGSSFSGQGDQDGRVADAGVVVHETVLLQVDAGGCWAVPRAIRSHGCSKQVLPCQPPLTLPQGLPLNNTPLTPTPNNPLQAC